MIEAAQASRLCLSQEEKAQASRLCYEWSRVGMWLMNMRLKTYSAPTMAEALVRVKQEMGGDAVIVHMRTYQRRHWLGLTRRDVVEITASKDSPKATIQKRPLPADRVVTQDRWSGREPFAKPATQPVDTLSALAASRRAAMKPAPSALPAGRHLLDTPAAGTAAGVTGALSDEMAARLRARMLRIPAAHRLDDGFERRVNDRAFKAG